MDIYLQVGHMFVKLFEHVYKPIGLVHMESIKCSGPTNNPQIKENEKEYVEKSVSSILRSPGGADFNSTGIFYVLQGLSMYIFSMMP